jgi:hypothetical protein
MRVIERPQILVAAVRTVERNGALAAHDTGLTNTGLRNTGLRNTGLRNTGLRNTGLTR